MTGVGGRIASVKAASSWNNGAIMRQAFQGAVLAVAVGVQMITFYSVLYA